MRVFPIAALACLAALAAAPVSANIGVGEPGFDISCDAARGKVANPSAAEEPAASIAYASRDLACRMAALNAEDREGRHVVVATYDAASRTMRFVPVPLDDRAAVQAACQLIGVVGSAGRPGAAAGRARPADTVLEGALGTSGCAAYLQQAALSAPLLVIVPNLVPGKRLSVRDWRDLTRLFGSDGERLHDSVTIDGGAMPLTVVPPAAAAARSACHLLEC
ncbi:MAG: hypothetical protein U1E53_10505 [Dongiaceae bacterium]